MNNNFNIFNITSGTLTVSWGWIVKTNLNNNQIYIGNRIYAILQNLSLIWDNASHGLGIGVTQFLNPMTKFQVNNRWLWVDSTPNSSITVLSTENVGIGTTEAYIKWTENADTDFRAPLLDYYNFRCADKIPLFIDKDSRTVENTFVIDSKLVKYMNVSGKATVQNIQVWCNSCWILCF